MELHPVEVRGPNDVERALSAIAHGQAEALVVSDASLLGLHAKQIGDFVVEQRLPTIGASRRYLMTYGCSGDPCGAGQPSSLTRSCMVPGRATSPWSGPRNSS